MHLTRGYPNGEKTYTNVLYFYTNILNFISHEEYAQQSSMKYS